MCIWGTPQDTFNEATVVFSGVVVKISEPNPIKEDRSYHEGQKTTFRVGQVWKGPLFEEFEVETSPTSSAGVKFEMGKNYIVYATLNTWNREFLKTDNCMRVQLLEKALVDRVLLRDPFVVDPEICLVRPTVSELKSLSLSEDPLEAQRAKNALSALKKE